MSVSHGAAKLSCWESWLGKSMAAVALLLDTSVRPVRRKPITAKGERALASWKLALQALGAAVNSIVCGVGKREQRSFSCSRGIELETKGNRRRERVRHINRGDAGLASGQFRGRRRDQVHKSI